MERIKKELKDRGIHGELPINITCEGDDIWFPIEDVWGKQISRVRYNKNEDCKYWHFPYSKTSNLFFLNYSKTYVLKLNWILVVEGYFDVFHLWSVGIKNVAACCGSALAIQQIMLAARYTERIVALFDGDKSGIKSKLATQSLYKGNTHGVFVKSISLKNGLDPDDYLRKYDKDAFISFLKKELIDDKTFSDKDVLF